jgi:hypothetical protein
VRTGSGHASSAAPAAARSRRIVRTVLRGRMGTGPAGIQCVEPRDRAVAVDGLPCRRAPPTVKDQGASGRSSVHTRSRIHDVFAFR